MIVASAGRAVLPDEASGCGRPSSGTSERAGTWEARGQR